MQIEKVTFEPHTNGWVKVTAHARDERDNRVVYLDPVSAKSIIQNSLWAGQATPSTDFHA